MRPRVAFVQDGARLHYALPLALQRAGILERVFADWFETPASFEQLTTWLFRRFHPALGERMVGRKCAELDGRKVLSNPLLTIRQQLGRRRFKSDEAFYTSVSTSLGQWVRHAGWGKANSLFGFIRHLCPDLCAFCRAHGLLTVGEQIIAPAAVEFSEAELQRQTWPNWEPTSSADDVQRLIDKEQRTWQALAHVTCPSQYVLEGLVGQGVPRQSITVLPYPLDCRPFRVPDRSKRNRPLCVGFIGTVSLRKGAPFFFEVARRFDPRQVKFEMVGLVALSPSRVAAHKGPVELVGAVPRSRVVDWLEKFDVFFFPSTCEGSSGAVMEAMASGLPVVTTPNSGTVARDGVEGFIAPCHDVSRFTEAITRLADEPELRHTMGLAARRRAEEFSLESYSRQLYRLFSQLVQAPERSPASR